MNESSGFPSQNTQPLFALACSSYSQPQCAQGEFQPRTLNQGKYNHLSLEKRLIQEQHDPLQTAIPHRLPIKVPSFFLNLYCYFPLHFLKVGKEGKNPWTQPTKHFQTWRRMTPRAVKLRVFLLSCSANHRFVSSSLQHFISDSKCWQIRCRINVNFIYQINIDGTLR